MIAVIIQALIGVCSELTRWTLSGISFTNISVTNCLRSYLQRGIYNVQFLKTQSLLGT